ncbi:unnamed protein product [Brassica napus]|uniref:(rape) hypothetical protein n=1 Tax=Brassica napus TaxID=3708 RepID=A0A816IHW8_BRANA|nr:unnamed protein product [Brassica napus]
MNGLGGYQEIFVIFYPRRILLFKEKNQTGDTSEMRIRLSANV